MKITIASHNPVKIRAVENAFRSCFPGESLELEPLSADSGVSDQPMSDEETRQGARNRVAGARVKSPAAEFWVGLEGGLELIDGQLKASAWMVVAGRGGEVSEARTPTLPLPPEVTQLVLGGLELGEANDRVFSTVNSKQGGGAFGLLTGGLMTRESVYTQTMILALVPFVHELWSNTHNK